MSTIHKASFQSIHESPTQKPLVSIVIPAFNEAKVLDRTFEQIGPYIESLSDRYMFQAIVVNDGSTDDTAALAERIAAEKTWVQVIHHATNFGLSEALRTGIANSKGHYVLVLDADMSYGPEHIPALLQKISETKAKIVLASPYMSGGRVTNIPRSRYLLSRLANRMLARLANSKLSTLTSMVRVYDGSFIRGVVLRGAKMAVMPEVIYKAMILRADVVEIPGHLDWSLLIGPQARRPSSMRIGSHIVSTLMSGFAFRPFMFFIAPGLILGTFAVAVDFWIFAHFFESYAAMESNTQDRITSAVAQSYSKFPYTFIVGMLSTMLAVQLVALGILALQAKRYFEEVFSLGTVLNQRLIDLSQNGNGPIKSEHR